MRGRVNKEVYVTASLIKCTCDLSNFIAITPSRFIRQQVRVELSETGASKWKKR